MFKRYPFYWRSELDKKSPWKMRMFKRYSDYGGYGYGGGYGGSFGKRPDKWQMRMFKRSQPLESHSFQDVDSS